MKIFYIVAIVGLSIELAESRSPINLDVADFEKVAIGELLSSGSKVKGSGCECVGNNCGCCAHMEVEKIGLNDTLCVNVSYLPDQIGISVTFSFDGHVYVNETISAKNPPPLCFALPHLKDYASLCLKFYNLSASTTSLSGCVDIEAKIYHVFIEKVHLGCFKLGKRVNGFQESFMTKKKQLAEEIMTNRISQEDFRNRK